MLGFFIRRVLIGFTTVIFISIISFVIIQLPEGDFLDAYLAAASGSTSNVAGEIQLSPKEIETLRRYYGLDQPIYIQYLKWVFNMSKGSFGTVLDLQIPVIQLIGERLLLTVVLALASVLFTWLLAIPIGIYSAVRQHSIGDYTFTFVGFIGLAVPDFLFALVLMYFAFVYFDANIGGLFSPEYIEAPWSLGRVRDLINHLGIPAVVLGTSGTAALIRIMRANLLDELHRPYVVTARAKGLSEAWLILKYPVRVALNPFISTIGYVLPYLISGSIIVSVVLSLPTLGPALLRALLQQDMYLAGTIMMFIGVMTVIGTLISDVLLVMMDPRIRLGGSR